MKKVKSIVVLFLLYGGTIGLKSQELKVSVGADLVSAYLWRGLYCGPASIQPSISLTVGNFSIGAWSSASFESSWREFDLYAGYSAGNFSLLVTDYFFPRSLPDGVDYGYFDFSDHVFEATVRYVFGESVPLSVAWNTNFASDDDYSSYFETAYTFSVKSVDVDLNVGFTPWRGIY